MHASRSPTAAAAGLLLLAGSTSAIDVDASDSQSVIDAAGTIAANVMAIYPLNSDNSTGDVPGLFPEPYYFWESGLAWDTMLTYAATTGDDQYNDLISQALLFQVGPDYNYMPPNQSKSLGNDDQSFWALAAMTAEETGFPPPENDGVDSWLQLAQNVFDSQVLRWDNETCGGGLRWQIFTFNSGYNYKNSLSNGNFMQLAARLYASTQNETYAEWFNTAADWMSSSGLYDSETGAVYDGIDASKCGEVNHIQWTANTGTLISAYTYISAADMDAVSDLAPLGKLLNSTRNIFVNDDDILTEPACLPQNTCNIDQLAFRGVLARAVAVARDFDVRINPLDVDYDAILQASAEAAGESCTQKSCLPDWTRSIFDGSSGLSELLAALNAVVAALPQELGEAAGDSSSGGSSSSSGGGNSTSSGGNATSSGLPSGTSGGADASNSVPVQEENMGDARSASMFGLLGALGFAVAFFL